MSSKIKRGDEVVVIAGSHKGQRGKVLQVIHTKDRVVIEGVNLVKKHQKGTQENPDGAIIEREGSIHYSNIALASKFDAKAKKSA